MSLLTSSPKALSPIWEDGPKYDNAYLLFLGISVVYTETNFFFLRKNKIIRYFY